MNGLLLVVVVALLVWSLTGRTADNRRTKRPAGYCITAVIGVGGGVMFGLASLVVGLCNNAMSGADGCSQKDEAWQRHQLAAAVAAPFVTVGMYALAGIGLDRGQSATWSR